MTSRISAASLTRLVIGPGSSWKWFAGSIPNLEVSPTVGFNPTAADLDAANVMLPLFYYIKLDWSVVS